MVCCCPAAAGTLIVFAIPLVLPGAGEFLEAWLIARRQWIFFGIVLVVAKLVGVGLTVFIFAPAKDELLRLAWFIRINDCFICARARAHPKVDPIARRLREWRHALWHFLFGRVTVWLSQVHDRTRLAEASRDHINRVLKRRPADRLK
jgi:hypothetical protein